MHSVKIYVGKVYIYIYTGFKFPVKILFRSWSVSPFVDQGILTIYNLKHKYNGKTGQWTCVSAN